MGPKICQQERYRFGRLWIIGPHYEADGEQIRFAKLANMDDLPDEADGGPPTASRYITATTPAHRLPSMEIQSPLIHAVEDFRQYLQGALEGDAQTPRL